MRQISDSEYPLVICLTWTDVGGTKTLATNKLILQENNSGESEILVIARPNFLSVGITHFYRIFSSLSTRDIINVESSVI